MCLTAHVRASKAIVSVCHLTQVCFLCTFLARLCVHACRRVRLCACMHIDVTKKCVVLRLDYHSWSCLITQKMTASMLFVPSDSVNLCLRIESVCAFRQGLSVPFNSGSLCLSAGIFARRQSTKCTHTTSFLNLVLPRTKLCLSTGICA